MLKRQHIWCVATLALAMTACGGGGGGSEQSQRYQLSFSPATLTESFLQGAPSPLTVTATLDRPVSQTINAVIIDSAGVIEPNLQLAPGAGNSYQATVTPKAALAVGEYSGSLQVKLCFDSPTSCNSPLPGSPYALPYKFTVTAPPAAVVSPARLALDAYQDEVPALTIAANLPSGQTYPQIVDKTGVFQPNPPKNISGTSLSATLFLNSTLAPGSYAGNLELHVCKDLPCTQEVSGSPVLVPYSITLKAAINLSPLARAAGVGEWAQHQANAAHTGYLPLTLDASKFNRRWRWTVPPSESTGSSGGAGAIQPVVTSNGTVYAQTSGYFQSATLYALSEHDRSVRWKKEFGTVFAVNPPSTDGGQVYLASSGHQDTFMWSFDGSTGAINFRTAFGSQWEHYLAPAIANGSVYTNGGSYGGLLSFKAGDGTLEWFANLSQYDQWTPAVDANYAYAFMPNGLNVIKVAGGSSAFVIADPNNSLQAYSVNGAPMLIGPGNVVVVNGSGGSGSINRLVNFDIAARSVKWSIPGSFTQAPAFAKGVIYAVNGAQVEARSDADGSRLWAWAPDEASVDPFRADYGSAARNLVVTDNLLFVSTASKVYALSLSSHQTVWSFPKPGRLALSPNGVLYISVAAAGDLKAELYAINLN
ncbi:outer membrane protein assembly factor BamB family protein [Paucibacter soli]|uniref:outer membrane protein assembly factor BamB family protein n=1 Tax=Paucibacter soli TaxID=3133433 RepID=UPI0030B0C10B